MAWFVYECPPIDFNWHLLSTVKSVASRLASSEAESAVEHGKNEVAGEGGLSSDYFILSWESAKKAALQYGWEGDFRQEPRVLWLPCPDEADFRAGFVFKQDNNGTTFVVSPVELPHLRNYLARER
jgi:hypothetical protein